MCVLARREGVSLGAKEDEDSLSQPATREPAKAGTVAGPSLPSR